MKIFNTKVKPESFSATISFFVFCFSEKILSITSRNASNSMEINPSATSSVKSISKNVSGNRFDIGWKLVFDINGNEDDDEDDDVIIRGID